MTVQKRAAPSPGSALPPSLGARLWGLGSVFGKTLRDSRAAVVVMAALLGLIVFAGGATMATTYGTSQARLDLAAMSRDLPPVLRGVYGNPIRVDTLGGFISWHYGAYFALLAGLWSILSLSSTLGAEARSGSLDITAAAPISRGSIALQKVAAHVAAMAMTMTALAIAAWLAGAVAAVMPGDAISAGAAVGFAIGVGAKGLVAGSIAFALAPFVGRGAAAGIAGAMMVAGYVVTGYRTVVPAFDTLAGLSWFSWTFDHVPMAGLTDWPAVALVAAVTIVLLALGVAAFSRHDIGVTVAVPVPAVPGALLGTRGPFGRAFGELLPAAVAWGVGIGLYGFVMAATSGPFIDAVAAMPGLVEAVRGIVPGIDLSTSAGFLQLAFTELGFVLAGLAAATFVAGAAAHETGGRLELQLAAPLSRVRWAVSSGAAAVVAVVVVTAVLAVALGAGIATVGDDPVLPALGTVALALYGAALAGVGAAVAGLYRPSFAAPVVLAVAVGTSLLDILGPALRVPEWLLQLALTSHLGEPMVGWWDAGGIVACLLISAGGIALGAWGLDRRDLVG